MKISKKIFVLIAISILFLTSNSSADLLDKCIKQKGDINNNGTVSKFERKICDTKLDAAGLIGEGKKLNKELDKAKEENVRLKQIVLKNIKNANSK